MDDHVTRFRLLGIDTGHMIERLPVEERDAYGDWHPVSGNQRVAHYSDMAIVAPIWKVVDLLEREDLADERNRKGAELEEQRGPSEAVSDAATQEAEPTLASRGDFEAALEKVSRRKPSPPDA
jgi:hypothetical protein